MAALCSNSLTREVHVSRQTTPRPLQDVLVSAEIELMAHQGFGCCCAGPLGKKNYHRYGVTARSKMEPGQLL